MKLEELIHHSQADELSAVLKATFTEKELQMVSERWAIFRGFYEGRSQRDIAQALGCGIATVTRGAKAYREYKQLLDNILQKCTPTA
ncbi:MAG: Trp family transcriptional regulator [Sphingobacteriia bacterium]